MNAKNLETAADFYTYTILLLTFLTTFVAICYQVYISCTNSANLPGICFAGVITADPTVETVFNTFSFILPITTSIFLTVKSMLDPIAKWSFTLQGAETVKGEIFRYRARTGIYQAKKSSNNANEKKGGKDGDSKLADADQNKKKINARTLFAKRLSEFWTEFTSDMRSSRLVYPDEGNVMFGTEQPGLASYCCGNMCMLFYYACFEQCIPDTRSRRRDALATSRDESKETNSGDAHLLQRIAEQERAR